MANAREGRIVITQGGPDRNNEEPELDFRALVVDDFGSHGKLGPLASRKPVRVRPGKLGEAMRQLEPRVTIVVPDRTSGADDGEFEVDLELNSIKDFEPDSIVENCPQLRRLKRLRDALKSFKGPLSSKPGFKKMLEGVFNDPEKVELLLSVISSQGSDAGDGSGDQSSVAELLDDAPAEPINQ